MTLAFTMLFSTILADFAVYTVLNKPVQAP